jgi:hypothetical protein
MYVVAMIKSEYQIKKIYAQNEIEKGEKKSTNERLSIPFTFNRYRSLTNRTRRYVYCMCYF